MPLVECKLWCRNHDGHPDQTAREDQVCGTPEATIVLRHIQKESGDPQWNFLSTYVEQSPEENPWVHIGVGDSSGLRLTLEESVSLALRLLEQAELVRRSAVGDTSYIGMAIGEDPRP